MPRSAHETVNVTWWAFNSGRLKRPPAQKTRLFSRDKPVRCEQGQMINAALCGSVHCVHLITWNKSIDRWPLIRGLSLTAAPRRGFNDSELFFIFFNQRFIEVRWRSSDQQHMNRSSPSRAVTLWAVIGSEQERVKPINQWRFTMKPEACRVIIEGIFFGMWDLILVDVWLKQLNL